VTATYPVQHPIILMELTAFYVVIQLALRA